MTSALAQENELLNLLRARYEVDNYTFIVNPGRDILPSFLGSYVPDAVALKGNDKIAIEISSAARKKGAPDSLTKLNEIFSQQTEWTLRVVQARDLGRLAKSPPLASTVQIKRALDNAAKLSNMKHYDAAFITAWAAFEAAARSRDANQANKIFPPKSIVESLERNGHITSSMGRQLRNLIQVRSAIVHGSFQRHATKMQVEMLTTYAKLLLVDKRRSDK